MLSVIDHLSYLERVHKSFIVYLSSFTCTEIESLQYKESFTFYKTNTHIITWPFLTVSHQGI